MKEIKAYKKIFIPHLKYTVYVKDLSELKGVEIKGSGYTCVFEDFSACIFLEDVKNVCWKENIPIIAHEAMHVIQIICEKFGMKVENEQEHTAFLLMFLIEEIIKGK